MEADALKYALYWGPAILVLYGLYKLLMKLGGAIKPFVESFINAQQNQATALAAQAAATEKLNTNFQDFISRDNSEHREMLIILKMIAQNMQSFEKVKLEHNEIHGADGAHCGGEHGEG